jgi:hypothetical protein
MNFHDFQTTRDIVIKDTGEKIPDIAHFYADQMAHMIHLREKGCAIQAYTEGIWEKLRRPFYNVYPTIAPMLLRLNLDFDSSLVKLPFDSFLLRFPVGREPISFDFDGAPWPIRAILVGPTSLYKGMQTFDGIVFWVDFGERGRTKNGTEFPVYSYINLPTEEGLSVDESLAALPYDESSFEGVVMPNEIRTACVKLACAVCMIGEDDTLIEPDVLAKDRARYWQNPDPKIVERAHRRGKIGYNIGRKIEVIPHVRRPHPALYWVGPGRVNPTILMRRGSVIHKDVVNKVPSGFMKDD